MTDLDSKDIIETYLDRDLTQVLGETGIQSIILSETRNELTATEVEIIAALIERKHDETSMERVRKNISLLEFRNVIESTSNIELGNDNDDDEDDEDSEIQKFISRLEKLQTMIKKDIELLNKKRELEISKLENNIKLLNFDDTSPNIDSEFQSLTEDINTYNLSMINKS
ncbi:hypothetical protein C6P40_000194 [Pichia californica]|uniref:Uncharacterized protein n=1 Tax=Pichia californica TaxID=460514 RepID=A0A9P6WKY7_9ASCO|nr:hypothetical protein C6P42_005023 [[Candida] californica]KAG0689055.1 hypothetical protein C6P40_000194 [[Candida] californica]